MSVLKKLIIIGLFFPYTAFCREVSYCVTDKKNLGSLKQSLSRLLFSLDLEQLKETEIEKQKCLTVPLSKSKESAISKNIRNAHPQVIIWINGKKSHKVGRKKIKNSAVSPEADFRLLDQAGRSHLMSYYSDFEEILLIGYSHHCPSPAPDSKLGEKVKAFFIDADVDATREELAKTATPLPVLIDNLQIVASSFGIKAAGDFVVLKTPDLTIKSRGRLREGLEPCFFKNPSPHKPSYLEAAAVIKTHCLSCHMSSARGDFSSYEKLFGWSAMIKKVLRVGSMPPGGRDPQNRGFIDDMSDGETATLVRWLESGMPGPLAGQEDPLPGAKLMESKKIDHGKADFVFVQKEKHIIPAEGKVDYRYVQLAGPFKEDLFVKGIRVKLNGRVVHHSHFLLLDQAPPKNALEMDSGVSRRGKLAKVITQSQDADGNMAFLEEAGLMTVSKANRSTFFLQDQFAYKIAKGQYLAIEFHYVPTGRIEENQTQVELFTYKNPDPSKLYLVKRLSLYRNGFKIPAGEKNFVLKTSNKLPKDMTILAFRSHFHFRGKSVKYSATLPDGEKKILHAVPHFRWRGNETHYLKEGIFLPKDTIIESEAVFDNSKENPQNPDPEAAVKSGPNTYTNEMHNLRMLFVDGKTDGGLLKKDDL